LNRDLSRWPHSHGASCKRFGGSATHVAWLHRHSRVAADGGDGGWKFGFTGATNKKSACRSATEDAPMATTANAPKQSFTVNHLDESSFASGLRAYAKYRDLGIAAATKGLATAQVIRFVPPCTDEVRQKHFHTVQFQMIYVLKGWIKSEFEGEGAHVMKAGSCWIQPPGIHHMVVDYSDDCEVLEIVLPAEFETVTLPKA
jgi:uncharacterized cupin superfamily protein